MAPGTDKFRSSRGGTIPHPFHQGRRKGPDDPDESAYAEFMAKEIDRIRARSALETIRESPLIAAIALLPVLAVLGVVWWLTNWFVALVLLIVFGVVVVVRGRIIS